VTTFFLFLQPSEVPPISELGFDAYFELPSAETLIEAFKPRKASVKALLLDQVLHRGRETFFGIAFGSFKLWEILSAHGRSQF